MNISLNIIKYGSYLYDSRHRFNNPWADKTFLDCGVIKSKRP